MTSRSRLQLAVDDAGEFLLVDGEALTIGHVRGRDVDLPLLADLAPRHARVRFRGASFHSGAAWLLSGSEELAAAGRRLRVNGRSIDAEVELCGGDRVELTDQLAFAFRLPDPGSSSAAVEFERGVECFGAQRVILFTRGVGGRVRLSRRSHSHVRVSRLAAQIELQLEDSEIRIHSTRPLSLDAAPALEDFNVALPLGARVALTLARAAEGEPPFTFTLAPLR